MFSDAEQVLTNSRSQQKYTQPPSRTVYSYFGRKKFVFCRDNNSRRGYSKRRRARLESLSLAPSNFTSVSSLGHTRMTLLGASNAVDIHSEVKAEQKQKQERTFNVALVAGALRADALSAHGAALTPHHQGERCCTHPTERLIWWQKGKGRRRGKQSRAVWHR